MSFTAKQFCHILLTEVDGDFKKLYNRNIKCFHTTNQSLRKPRNPKKYIYAFVKAETVTVATKLKGFARTVSEVVAKAYLRVEGVNEIISN